MTNALSKSPQAVIKDVNVQKMITERLGKRAGQFTTSLLSVVNSNKMIAACDPMTIVQAALTAASMDLPINQNLGFAYIVPYSGVAQFQMGWKGFVQLAQRSGKFKTINTTDVREGEVKDRDRMTGELTFTWYEDDAERNKKPIVGYLAYFELLNGFRKSLYMTKAEIEHHAGRYSQAYKAKGKSSFKSPWETDFDLMAQKTAIKLLLSKFAPLSTEMQEAIVSDQSVDDGSGRKYLDNGSDLDINDVGADDKQKAAILAANGATATDDEPDDDEDVTTPPPKGKVDEGAEEATDDEPKESVKEKAARKYGPKQQATLVPPEDEAGEDDSRSRNNPGE